jgi:hypothetical protein
MKNLQRILFSLSLLGFLFAGAVTTRQFVSPATTPGVFSCVGLSIFGFSPCPYGVAIFGTLALVAATMLWGMPTSTKVWVFRGVSLLGVAFSGWVVWREICVPALARGVSYWSTFSVARVPACAWGFLLFVAVAALAWRKTLRPQLVQPAA